MLTYEIIEIILLLFACFACFQAGIKKGISETVELLLENNLITPEDFDKLLDKKIKDLE